MFCWLNWFAVNRQLFILRLFLADSSLFVVEWRNTLLNGQLANWGLYVGLWWGIGLLGDCWDRGGRICYLQLK